MARFNVHTPETAPAPSVDILKALEETIGFIPNVFAVIAGTPVVLEAFAMLNQKFSDASLTETEREVLQMAVSVENLCGYCVAGHTAFALNHGVPAQTVRALRREDILTDERLNALAVFARAVVVAKGRIGDAELHRFLAAGFKMEQVQEVVLGICVKTFSNLISNLLDVPLDDAFQTHRWQPSGALQNAE
ncbi:carboxymuconolactone decarboxylase family protein [Pelagibius sp. Alg239-R121]|uniref:carboxymuconolactone decarboxylase family protein n=1 Tax=Pelagibius sp. Alg239-R121 TaxID=2993448 RepID=UPI0024A79559|nr:carboxymuconolactone decarboxylase family protein [Pelagibius sp. Alg239-R121]